MDGSKVGWMDERMDGRANGRMYRRMDGRMDGRERYVGGEKGELRAG